MKASATACANIALVKYWGKRDERLNLPARGSLSVTMDALRTATSVSLTDDAEDSLVINGIAKPGKPLARASRFLDLIRAMAKSAQHARIESTSTFPIAGGLASSASGFAALAVAGARAYGVELDRRELSVLARQGSGSAARSIFGGFVRMHAGVKVDGSDAFAAPVAGVELPLAAAIALAPAKEKAVSSTDGMEETRRTSPYHDAWLAQVDQDLREAELALKHRDLVRLGEISEGSCLAMHADAMAARPGIIYFGPTTLWAIERVRRLRADGTPVFFTIDAGPHVVAFCEPAALETVRAALAENAAIAEVITSAIGGDAVLG